MPWTSRARKQRLPGDWLTRRRRVLERDGFRCTVILADGTRCREQAREVDHIVAGDDHSLTNLRAICSWHHRRKSSAEGNAAQVRPTQRYPKERHPGIDG